jgi:hypothetical protein
MMRIRCNTDHAEASGASRRTFIKTSALALAATVAPAVARFAFAQAPRLSSDLDRLRSSSRILIRNAVVISMDRQLGDFANADILIEGDRIREVRPDIAASAESTAVVDGRDRIVIPGFIDPTTIFIREFCATSCRTAWSGPITCVTSTTSSPRLMRRAMFMPERW